MSTVTTIGLDIAKSVFQVHGVDASGEVRDAAAGEASAGCCSSLLSCRPV